MKSLLLWISQLLAFSALLRGNLGAKPLLKLSGLSNLSIFYKSRLRFKTFADVMMREVR